MKPSVHLFWDNSNIFIPAKYAAERREGTYAFQGARVHFNNLHRLAHGGRSVDAGVCVGSVPPELRRVWDRLEATGVKIELFERGQQTRREQGVDQCLQVHMLRAALDFKPGTAVLLTGDGAGYEDGSGFHADLERLSRLGWGIEVLAWRSACKRALREFAETHGVFVALDDFYDSVTFIEGCRQAMPLSLTRRRYASPGSVAA